MVDQFDRALRLAGTRIAESVANFLPGAVVFLVLLIGALVVAVVLRYALRRALSRPARVRAPGDSGRCT